MAARHEHIILWVMYRMYQLEKAGLIEPHGSHALRLTDQGVELAKHLFETIPPPSEEDVRGACNWLFRRGPLSLTEGAMVAPLTTLILDWKPQ